MSEPFPGDPGPAPGPFRFPFAQADIVVGALDELLGAVSVCRSRHANAGATAVQDWSGGSRTRFDQALHALLDELTGFQRRVGAQRADLEQDDADAGRRRAQRNANIDDWKRRRDSHDKALRELAAPGTRQAYLAGRHRWPAAAMGASGPRARQ